MRGYRKILIAVNRSKDVFRKGLRLAADENCWVTVLKVIPPYEGDLNLTGIKHIGDVLVSGAQKDIREIKQIAESERALIKTRVEEGAIDSKIVEVARDEDCDLIIIGANKTNWLRKLLGRNVLEKVIRNSPCPVLVVGS